jgi:hypothetical protein
VKRQDNRVVILEGGPMRGAVVGIDAPALWPEWYKTWPPARRGFWMRLLRRRDASFPPRDQRIPGRYVIQKALGTPEARVAVWTVLS